MFDFLMMLYCISGVILFVSYWQNANRGEVLWMDWIKVQTSHSNWFCTSFHCLCTLLNVQAALVPQLISVRETNLSQSNFNPTHGRHIRVA